jgi:6-phosphogluconate dehydrogenase
MSNADLHATFDAWNKAELNSFLIEITAKIFLKKDDKGGPGESLDKIKDAARQKGTGKWTSQDALDPTVPTPTIDAAVFGRKHLRDDRGAGRVKQKSSGRTDRRLMRRDRPTFVAQVKDALDLAGILVSYAQGLDSATPCVQSLRVRPQPCPQAAANLRGGCIIRATLLEDILRPGSCR